MHTAHAIAHAIARAGAPRSSPDRTRPPSRIALPTIAVVVSGSLHTAIDTGHTTSTAPPRDTVYTGPSGPSSSARARPAKYTASASPAATVQPTGTRSENGMPT